MRTLLMIIFIIINSIGLTQISVTNKIEKISGKNCTTFTFKNETNQYQNTRCIVTYFINVGEYTQKKIVIFNCNFLPNQIQHADLTYIEGNPYMLVNKHLIKFKIEFLYGQ